MTGEYKAILQLIAVLRKGKLAKRLTDQAIDSAAAVQNVCRLLFCASLFYSKFADDSTHKAT